MKTPKRPSSPIFFAQSCGNSWLSSNSWDRGMISCSVKSRTVLRVISWVSLGVKSIRASKVLPPDKISAAPTLISRESLAGRVAVTLEPLQTSDAHSYWRTFVAGRTGLPSRDLNVHLDRFLPPPPEDQRAHSSGNRDGRLIRTVRPGPPGA